MDLLHRSFSKLTHLCVNQDAKIATIRAVIVATILAGLLLLLMNLSDSEQAPDFAELEAGTERKQAFFDYFLPLIKEENQQLLAVREELIALYPERDSLSFFERMMVNSLAEEYELTDFDLRSAEHWQILIRRIDIVPPSLALVQAANESAWGTSRFATQANNFYGHWCYVEGCGLIPARRDAGARHFVAEFDSPEQSVERYIHNLNHHPAYRELRLKRAAIRASEQPLRGIELVSELEHYSERGEAYIEELSSMIRFNELSELDYPGAEA